MTQYYEPELGQLVFGCAWGEYELSPKLEDYLEMKLRELLLEVIDERYIEHNYVEEFKNDVFEMRDYYWGDCVCGYEEIEAEWSEQNRHQEHCYQKEYNELYQQHLNSNIPDEEVEQLCIKYGIDYDDGRGCAVHCTCDYEKRWEEFISKNSHKDDCPTILPNFKCGDFEVQWYKYIGRGMSVNRKISRNELKEIFRKCLASLEGREK